MPFLIEGARRGDVAVRERPHAFVEGRSGSSMSEACFMASARCALAMRSPRAPDKRRRSVSLLALFKAAAKRSLLRRVPLLSAAGLAPLGAALPRISRRCWRAISRARSRRSRRRFTRSDSSSAARDLMPGCLVWMTSSCSSVERMRSS